MTQPARNHYCTVVVGAGPAGVMAAIEASHSGPVLLAEAAVLPREKICGGMLNPHALEALAPFGRFPQDIVLSPATVRFRYQDWGRHVVKPTQLEFINVDRRAFDLWLFSLLPGDVEVASRCEVRGFTQNHEGLYVELAHEGTSSKVHADYLIAADGARSRIRRALAQGTSSTYVTIQDTVSLAGPLEPWFDCILMGEVDGGFAYAYVAPKGDTAIVGSVLHPHTRRPSWHHEHSLVRLRERIHELGDTLKRETAAALCVRSPKDIVHGAGRVLLVGEAAGFISPSSGEGISYAINSGLSAGRAVSASPNGDAHAYYRDATAPMASNIRRKLRWLKLIESDAGRRMAALAPAPLVSQVTRNL